MLNRRVTRSASRTTAAAVVGDPAPTTTAANNTNDHQAATTNHDPAKKARSGRILGQIACAAKKLTSGRRGRKAAEVEEVPPQPGTNLDAGPSNDATAPTFPAVQEPTTAPALRKRGGKSSKAKAKDTTGRKATTSVPEDSAAVPPPAPTKAPATTKRTATTRQTKTIRSRAAKGKSKVVDPTLETEPAPSESTTHAEKSADGPSATEASSSLVGVTDQSAAVKAALREPALTVESVPLTEPIPVSEPVKASADTKHTTATTKQTKTIHGRAAKGKSKAVVPALEAEAESNLSEPTTVTGKSVDGPSVAEASSSLAVVTDQSAIIEAAVPVPALAAEPVLLTVPPPALEPITPPEPITPLPTTSLAEPSEVEPRAPQEPAEVALPTSRSESIVDAESACAAARIASACPAATPGSAQQLDRLLRTLENIDKLHQSIGDMNSKLLSDESLELEQEQPYYANFGLLAPPLQVLNIFRPALKLLFPVAQVQPSISGSETGYETESVEDDSEDDEDDIELSEFGIPDSREQANLKKAQREEELDRVNMNPLVFPEVINREDPVPNERNPDGSKRLTRQNAYIFDKNGKAFPTTRWEPDSYPFPIGDHVARLLKQSMQPPYPSNWHGLMFDAEEPAVVSTSTPTSPRPVLPRLRRHHAINLGYPQVASPETSHPSSTTPSEPSGDHVVVPDALVPSSAANGGEFAGLSRRERAEALARKHGLPLLRRRNGAHAPKRTIQSEGKGKAGARDVTPVIQTSSSATPATAGPSNPRDVAPVASSSSSSKRNAPMPVPANRMLKRQNAVIFDRSGNQIFPLPPKDDEKLSELVPIGALAAYQLQEMKREQSTGEAAQSAQAQPQAAPARSASPNPFDVGPSDAAFLPAAPTPRVDKGKGRAVDPSPEISSSTGKQTPTASSQNKGKKRAREPEPEYSDEDGQPLSLEGVWGYTQTHGLFEVSVMMVPMSQMPFPKRRRVFAIDGAGPSSSTTPSAQAVLIPVQAHRASVPAPKNAKRAPLARRPSLPEVTTGKRLREEFEESAVRTTLNEASPTKKARMAPRSSE